MFALYLFYYFTFKANTKDAQYNSHIAKVYKKNCIFTALYLQAIRSKQLRDTSENLKVRRALVLFSGGMYCIMYIYFYKKI